MTAISGIWLYAVLFCFGVDAADPGCGPPQVVQRGYPTRVACEQARADILRKLPGAYATCLH
jgi:hypothetical protein